MRNGFEATPGTSVLERARVAALVHGETEPL
jgi:hypothetical protein